MVFSRSNAFISGRNIAPSPTVSAAVTPAACESIARKAGYECSCMVSPPSMNTYAPFMNDSPMRLIISRIISSESI